MACHGEGWGVPQCDPSAPFELLLLKGFQTGLSWITVLKKRERYRKVLFGFDVQRVAQMSDAEIGELILGPGIIRNRARLNATRQSTQAWLELDDPTEFLWSFVGGQPKINRLAGRAEVPAITLEAETMSKTLHKAGFSFVRPTICYAFMQVGDMAMDHTRNRGRYVQFIGWPGAP